MSLPPEAQQALEGYLDAGRTLAEEKGVVYLTVVKTPGHPEVMLEAGGGSEDQKAQLMSFFMQWALSRAAEKLKQG